MSVARSASAAMALASSAVSGSPRVSSQRSRLPRRMVPSGVASSWDMPPTRRPRMASRSLRSPASRSSASFCAYTTADAPQEQAQRDDGRQPPSISTVAPPSGAPSSGSRGAKASTAVRRPRRGRPAPWCAGRRARPRARFWKVKKMTNGLWMPPENQSSAVTRTASRTICPGQVLAEARSPRVPDQARPAEVGRQHGREDKAQRQQAQPRHQQPRQDDCGRHPQERQPAELDQPARLCLIGRGEGRGEEDPEARPAQAGPAGRLIRLARGRIAGRVRADGAPRDASWRAALSGGAPSSGAEGAIQVSRSSLHRGASAGSPDAQAQPCGAPRRTVWRNRRPGEDVREKEGEARGRGRDPTRVRVRSSCRGSVMRGGLDRGGAAGGASCLSPCPCPPPVSGFFSPLPRALLGGLVGDRAGEGLRRVGRALALDAVVVGARAPRCRTS